MISTHPEPITTRNRYEEALQSLVDKVKQERTIIAAILFGSLAYDEVWDKSDIDLILISSDEKKPTRCCCLVENGINIHAQVLPRSKFKAGLDGSLASSFFHSSFSRSRLLFSQDETITEYYNNVHHIGARDREMQLLRAGSSVLAPLAKAEKWFYIKGDLEYSFLWIMFCVDSLAAIEVILNGEVTGREVIHQALKYNPTFFRAIYTDLVQQKKDKEAIGAALRLINQYLEEKIDLLFRPILDHLAEAGGIRSTTELDAYFRKQVQGGWLALAYEWLAEKGILRQVSAPLRLSEKSKITLDEAAYYYDESMEEK